jgi:predicted nucleotide-binding protein
MSGRIGLDCRPVKDRVIFVVHGHDHTAKEQLELVLHRLGLEPFVLQDSGCGGKTIIETLEGMIGKEAKSAFGIVLLTPDDMGYSKRDGDKEAKPRARQNVILEMGMLLSSLTRGRVAILQKQFLERPSDLDGVLYIPFNDHVKETVPKLAQRLQESGIPLDVTAIARASS